MASVRIERARVGWHIWLQWVLASILGFAVGAAVGNAVIDSIPPMTCAQSSSDTLVDKLTNFPCMLPMLYGAFLGVAGGFMQWLVLRRQIAGAGWWVLASTLGFAIAVVAAMTYPVLSLADSLAFSLDGNPIAAPILIGVVFGVAGGILPWIVLRRKITRAGWWVLAHLLGSLVGGALGIITFHVVSLIGFYQFTWAAAGAMFGAGLGAITGITLVWLLRQPVSER